MQGHLNAGFTVSVNVEFCMVIRIDILHTRKQ